MERQLCLTGDTRAHIQPTSPYVPAFMHAHCHALRATYNTGWHVDINRDPADYQLSQNSDGNSSITWERGGGDSKSDYNWFHM